MPLCAASCVICVYLNAELQGTLISCVLNTTINFTYKSTPHREFSPSSFLHKHTFAYSEMNEQNVVAHPFHFLVDLLWLLCNHNPPQCCVCGCVRLCVLMRTCTCTHVQLLLFAITEKDLCNANRNVRSQDLNENLIFCLSFAFMGLFWQMPGKGRQEIYGGDNKKDHSWEKKTNKKKTLWSISRLSSHCISPYSSSFAVISWLMLSSRHHTLLFQTRQHRTVILSLAAARLLTSGLGDNMFS